MCTKIYFIYPNYNTHVILFKYNKISLPIGKFIYLHTCDEWNKERKTILKRRNFHTCYTVVYIILIRIGEHGFIIAVTCLVDDVSIA